MGALIFTIKFALASIPNVQCNAVLIILCTVFFGWEALYSVMIYVMLEGLVFGFSIWWFGYLYTWPLLVVIAMALRRHDDTVVWAVTAGVFGLIFGPLMYLEYFAINGGWQGFAAMWVSGIPYDLVHCASNCIITFVLYRPLYHVTERLLGPPDFKKQSPQD